MRFFSIKKALKQWKFQDQYVPMGRIVGIEPMHERFTAACVNLFTISAKSCRKFPSQQPIYSTESRLVFQ